MKLSVIIPVYNGEATIARCLDSILIQSMELPKEEYEVIIINDGSSDSTIKILEEYRKKDIRVITENQQNKGVSAARNRGIEKASGQWIMFVDADDYIDQECIASIWKLMDQEYDFIFWNRVCIRGERPSYRNAFDGKEYICSGEELIPKTFNMGKYLTIGGPIAKTFRHSIIKENNLKFDCLLYWGEDGNFLRKYLVKCRKCIGINEFFYYCVSNVQSSTHRFHKDATQQILDYISIEKRSMQENGLWDKNKKCFWEGFFHNMLNNWLYSYLCNPNNKGRYFERKMQLVELLKNSQLEELYSNVDFEHLSIKGKIKYLCIRYHILFVLDYWYGKK